MHALVTCKYKKDRIKTTEKRGDIISKWGLSIVLGRYIDTLLYRDTNFADTLIDTLGALSRYFHKTD